MSFPEGRIVSDPVALEDRDEDGGRLFSPSAARNREVIGEQLAGILPKGARVLEIASGTGEHAVHMAMLRPDLRWQPSDIDPASIASQLAWRSEAPDVIAPSLTLSTTDSKWWAGFDEPFDAVFCANMIHIAPWPAAVGLSAGAGHLLAEDGECILYGPFLKNGAGPQSNRDFDTSLKSRNPAWGVRELADVKQLFATHGLALAKAVAMPANNDLLVFGR